MRYTYFPKQELKFTHPEKVGKRGKQGRKREKQGGNKGETREKQGGNKGETRVKRG